MAVVGLHIPNMRYIFEIETTMISKISNIGGRVLRRILQKKNRDHRASQNAKAIMIRRLGSSHYNLIHYFLERRRLLSAPPKKFPVVSKGLELYDQKLLSPF